MINNNFNNNGLRNILPALNDHKPNANGPSVLPSLSKTGNSFYPSQPFRDNSNPQQIEKRKHSNRHEKIVKQHFDDSHSARIDYPNQVYQSNVNKNLKLSQESSQTHIA